MRFERSFDASAPPAILGTAPWVPSYGDTWCIPHDRFGHCSCSRHHCNPQTTRHDCCPDSPCDSLRDSLGDMDGTSVMVPQLGVPAAETPPRSARGRWRVKARRTSGHGAPPKAAPLLAFSPTDLGHSSPQRWPPHCPQPSDANPLGRPLSIAQVAALIGCSAWTVRQKYLPLGLPHSRVGPTGKLLFYKNQVIRWLMRRQKGKT